MLWRVKHYKAGQKEEIICSFLPILDNKDSIYCVYVAQSVIAGKEVTVIQSCVDHYGCICREVSPVQDIRQIYQCNVFILPKRRKENEKEKERKKADMKEGPSV